MNKEEIGGKAEQVTGKIKEKVGEAIGNQNMANKGVADQVKGAAKETWGKAKDVAAGAVLLAAAGAAVVGALVFGPYLFPG